MKWSWAPWQLSQQRLCGPGLLLCRLICFAAAPPIGNEQQGGPMQIDLDFRVWPVPWCRKTMGQSFWTWHVVFPHAELRERLSLRVNLLSVLGRNSHTRKDSERIFRLNEVLFVAFKVHVTNKYFHLLKPCQQSLLFSTHSGDREGPLKGNELWASLGAVFCKRFLARAFQRSWWYVLKY